MGNGALGSGDLALALYDPTSGAEERKVVLPQQSSWMLPTNPEGDLAEPLLKYNGQFVFSPDLDYAVGIDAYSHTGDQVPSRLDLETGQVEDLVEPSDQTGFAAKDPVYYSWSGVSPTTGHIWALHGLTGDPDNWPRRFRLEDLTTGEKLETGHARDFERYDDWYPTPHFERGKAAPVIPPPDFQYGEGKNLYFSSSESLQQETKLNLGELVYSEAPEAPPVFLADRIGTGEVYLYALTSRTNPDRLADLTGESAPRIVAYRWGR